LGHKMAIASRASIIVDNKSLSYSRS